MHSKHLISLFAASMSLALIAAESPRSSGVIQLDHEKVAAMFSQGGTLLATNNFKVMALRRNGPGEVEIHDNDTDIFYILEGSATLVSGGHATEARPAGPGETRARTIIDGEQRHVVKGDVVIIPNRVPHWFKEVSPPFLYYTVKVSK